MTTPRSLEFLPEVTMEISTDIIAFSPEHARTITDEYRHPRYWESLEVDTRWWFVGENGQGDRWLLGPDGGIWLFDHNHGELATHLFEPLRIDVTEWLILGHALRAFERLGDPTDDDIARLDAVVESISPGLAERYPYELPFV
ncbi:hypothetical protein [Microbacterium gorillae]|uniref:hypothetical protein n=1 Tax=Microbacterium gorillae TaxID=1231063 RepID=UPI000693526E|nr:hypothetical protein [Microbacterium gorillae]